MRRVLFFAILLVGASAVVAFFWPRPRSPATDGAPALAPSPLSVLRPPVIERYRAGILPAGFSQELLPDSVAIRDISASVTRYRDGSSQENVTFIIEASPEHLRFSYRRALLGNRWLVKPSDVPSEALVAEKDGQTLHLVITALPSGSRVTLARFLPAPSRIQPQ